MTRSLFCSVLVIFLMAPVVAADVLFEGRFARVDTDQALPTDLIAPEGKTRWDFAGIELREVLGRKQIRDDADSSAIRQVEWSIELPEPDEVGTRVADAAGGDAAIRWLRPHEDPFLLKTRDVPEIRVSLGAAEVRIETRRVGMGWLLLPSGPRETVLQRAWIHESGDGEAHGTIVHRWIDPRVGVVARVWGPASADGSRRLSIEGAEVLQSVIRGSAPMKLYPEQVQSEPCGPPPEICDSRLAVGYAREGFCTGSGDPCVDHGDCGLFSNCYSDITGLTTPSYADMGALIAAGAWDFSPNNSTNDVAITASIAAEVNADETCNYGQCGFVAGRILSREDKFEHLEGTVRRTLSVSERTEPPEGPTTIWLRGGTRNEGYSGGLGAGESRFCYDPADSPDPENPLTEVPLWEFAHQDANGWYMQLGDAWESDPFHCENNIYNHVCPSNCDDVWLCRVYASVCEGYAGTQGTTVVAEGPVTLPSGHTFHSLVARNVSEFCIWIDNSDCPGSGTSRVRTIVYMWQVPYLGTVARLVSPQNGPADFVSFSDIAEADIKFGLYPPLSVSTGAVDDTTVQLSWDPGLETTEIDGYAVHWGSVSGAVEPYANQAPQPASAGTSATIGGLIPGTEYFLTVTSLSDYENPATEVTTTYESMLFPLSIEANGGGFIPVEVSATTTCTVGIPPVEIHGLTANEPSENDVEICWEPSPNTCITGYEILGATSPELPGNFSVLATHTGPGNCHTLIDPTEGYFLVRAKGTAGSGPM